MTFNDINLSALFFPGLLLLFLVPMPGGFREWIVDFLIKGTAEVSEILFKITGSSFYRRGVFFFLPGVSIEIAQECSGIRSSIGLLITMLLAGHLFFEKAWSKILLVALVLPLVLIKNAMRVVGLTLLAVHVDRAFLDSSLHHTYGGVVFFSLTLLLVFPLLLFIRMLEKKQKTGKVRI